ncbi:MAG: flagellin lysine-N-methylase [Lachnospiraceae bacterium]|nr:flagellin lysine-N-methylase [Lachnospiraceae bacterium]
MRYVYPNYYSKFECIGGKCSDTCCAGWEVDVDDDTAEMYRSIPLPIGDRLRDRLRGSEGTYHFELAGNKRCPFLNEDNLCDLILSLGNGGMCVTCTEYPRFYADTPIYEQVDLTLSCPEAARIFFLDTDPIRYIVEDIDEDDKDDDGEFGDDPFGHNGNSQNDEEFYRELEESHMDESDENRLLNLLKRREVAFSIMADRTQSLENRWNGAVSIVFAHKSGTESESESISELPDVSGGLNQATDDENILNNIKDMEVVNPLWAQYMTRISSNLKEVQSNIDQLINNRSKYLDNEMERLLTYFIFRYAIDIYYHDNPDKTLLFIKRCFRIVLLLIGEKFIADDSLISVSDYLQYDDFMRALLEERGRIFSRQIEHSDDNVSELMRDMR